MGPIEKVNEFHDLNELRRDLLVSGGSRRGEFNGEALEYVILTLRNLMTSSPRNISAHHIHEVGGM